MSKRIGLSCLCLFVFLLVPAQQGLALSFHSEVAPVTLKGSGIEKAKMTFQAGSLQCASSSYSGTVATTVASSIELAPTLASCTFLGSSAPVHFNGCLEQPTFLSVGIDADILCFSGKKIEITGPSCTIDIPAQKGINQYRYKNSGSGFGLVIQLIETLKSLKYTQTGISCFGNGGIFEKSFTDGTSSATIELKGFDKGGMQRGIWIE